ncbi:DUF1345 domain-containing protein [Ornithinimicrobium avium]|uniref:DUF1345 domain-containing protein n=1 Tax=Ornithinimicrobium avium TaxID=2283195 RepID=UPI0013B35A15|nr:DUF1345 domain-containing protein [Ornithinimicrobium avium]
MWAWATDHVFVFFATYLVLYVVLTAAAFTLVPQRRVSAWAARTTPGTWVDHVLRGNRPGPGQAAMLSLVALVSVLAWHTAEPQHGWLAPGWRAVVSVALLAAAWCAVLLTYAVAYLCQDARSGRRELEFPGGAEPVWGDYLYAAVGVSTTFGTTDVTVVAAAMRRTVTVHAVLAFFFNTVIIVTAVTLLLG